MHRRLKLRSASAESLRYAGAGHLRIITRCAAPGAACAPLTAANAERINLALTALSRREQCLGAWEASTRAAAWYRHAVPVVPSIRQGLSTAPARRLRRDDEAEMALIAPAVKREAEEDWRGKRQKKSPASAREKAAGRGCEVSHEPFRRPIRR